MNQDPINSEPKQHDETDTADLSGDAAAEPGEVLESDEASEDKDSQTVSREEVEALQGAVDEAKEQALRAAAELQNVQRRAKLDVEKAHKFALEKFVADLLPVADNLERAITASEQEAADMSSVVEGVELTLKSLIDALKKHGVESVDPAGEPFNPETSQAMTMVPNPELEPNTVMDVFQKGYTLSGRLVRPAMVVVSKSES